MVASSHCGNVQDPEDEASAPGAADLYAVLGLNRECTDAELRVAYRRLAMIWHPDRCSASGSSARVEEAKERFQEIQGVYSVLSDSNKRLLYDVGVYDSDDDEADKHPAGGNKEGAQAPSSSPSFKGVERRRNGRGPGRRAWNRIWASPDSASW